MTKERLQEVLEILSKANKQGINDYYYLFNLDKNMTIEQIKTQIKQKKLQVLFHHDQINFIPQEYHEQYIQMIEVVKDVINTFDNDYNKEIYDENIEKLKQASNNKNNDWENKTLDLEEVNFQQAIIINSEKYGFEYTMKSILQLLQKQNVSGFTRDNNARGMIAAISKSKILKILASSSLEDTNYKTMDQIIMNYLTDLIYNTPSLRIQIDSLEQACINTIHKYDLNGHYGQTKIALDKFCAIGNASSFTNTNNCRNNLLENVYYKNANFYMYCSLNKQRHNNQNLAYENFITSETPIDLTQIYVNNLINQEYNANNYQESYNR